MLPNNADKRLLFPDPIFPTTATREPLSTSKLILVIAIKKCILKFKFVFIPGSSLLSHEKLPFCTEIAKS